MLLVKDLTDLGIAPKKGWLTGPVFCFNCSYSWIAIRPTLTFLVQCPRCWEMRAN